MPRSVLYNNLTIAASKPNGSNKNCRVHIPARDLNPATAEDDVTVVRTSDGRGIPIKQVSVVPARNYPQVLVLRTQHVPKTHFGDTEEITVTVTDPDDNTNVADTTVEVVYYDETPTRGPKRRVVARKKKAPARKKKKAARR